MNYTSHHRFDVLFVIGWVCVGRKRKKEKEKCQCDSHRIAPPSPRRRKKKRHHVEIEPWSKSIGSDLQWIVEMNVKSWKYSIHFPTKLKIKAWTWLTIQSCYLFKNHSVIFLATWIEAHENEEKRSCVARNKDKWHTADCFVMTTAIDASVNLFVPSATTRFRLSSIKEFLSLCLLAWPWIILECEVLLRQWAIFHWKTVYKQRGRKCQ